MKAAIHTTYGPPEVLRLADIPEPIAGPNELLVRIHASAVNSADWRLRKADPFFIRLVFGLLKPKRAVLGVVFAGEVVATGTAVKKHAKGDRLFGWTNLKTLGGHAAFTTLPENGAFTAMPSSMCYTDAAAIPFGFATALHFLRKANVSKGQRVLIHGASGSVGSAAVQLAHHMGAEVTGVCSTRNVELVRSLGAKEVIDYTKDGMRSLADPYDVMFETVGKLPVKACLNLVKQGGTIIVGSEMPAQALVRAFNGTRGRKVIGGTASESSADMRELAQLWEQGVIQPVIDRVLPIDNIVEAHTIAESGRKVGNLVITIP